MIFQTDNTPGFYYYEGIWKPFGGSSSNTGWDLTGNTGTSPGTNYLGTTDSENLLFKTNATNSFEMTTNRRLRAYEKGTAALPVYSWVGSAGQKMGMYQFSYTSMNQSGANITVDAIGISTNGKERIRFLDRGQIEVNKTTQPYTDLRNQFSVYANNTGTQNRGIYVMSYGSTGTGVFVTNEDGGSGVNATSRLDNGTGVAGYNNDGNGVGVFGGSGSNSNWGTGVHGNSVKGAGVFGESTQGNGIYGVTYVSGGIAGDFNADVSAIAYRTTSDRRFKSNITSLKEGNNMLKKVMSLSPKSYNWRAAEFPALAFDPNKKAFGFIAQDLKEIFPELVYFNKIHDPKLKKEDRKGPLSETEYYSVDYTGLIPILTEAIQEQQTIIDSQEERIAKLESLVQQMLNK